jgi:hypothetical protein
MEVDNVLLSLDLNTQCESIETIFSFKLTPLKIKMCYKDWDVLSKVYLSGYTFLHNPELYQDLSQIPIEESDLNISSSCSIKVTPSCSIVQSINPLIDFVDCCGTGLKLIDGKYQTYEAVYYAEGIEASPTEEVNYWENVENFNVPGVGPKTSDEYTSTTNPLLIYFSSAEIPPSLEITGIDIFVKARVLGGEAKSLYVDLGNSQQTLIFNSTNFETKNTGYSLWDTEWDYIDGNLNFSIELQSDCTIFSQLEIDSVQVAFKGVFNFGEFYSPKIFAQDKENYITKWNKVKIEGEFPDNSSIHYNIVREILDRTQEKYSKHLSFGALESQKIVLRYIPTKNDLSSITLKSAGKIGNPQDNVKVEICELGGTEEGYKVLNESITKSWPEAGSEINFFFPSTYLTVGTPYFFKISRTGEIDNSNYFKVASDENVGEISSGVYNGINWNYNNNIAPYYKIYGYEVIKENCTNETLLNDLNYENIRIFIICSGENDYNNMPKISEITIYQESESL